MKKQAFNPYLPSWEYIPDGEPYVFDGRVYIYGSHDFFNGYVFCLGDYICYSAPVDDLSDWRYEGVIFKKTDDPMNRDGKMNLFAPDVTKGPDGKYYLYYVLDKVPVVSVAVCDTPAGKYEFLGYVHYLDGTRLGEREGDEPQFDPGVLTEGDTVYLYTGFCSEGDKTRHGAMCTVLEKDMLTVKEAPVFVAPGCEYDEGSGFEDHAFFEASSIRKFNNKYYFIYSSEVMHELCYAMSDSPKGKFEYKGVLVSNIDKWIDSYKPADMPAAYGANNHGSVERINDDYYIFYHRHTNNTWYSRQACAERLVMNEDGTFEQASISSCGLNGGALEGKGEYPAYIVCNMFTDKPCGLVGIGDYPKVMQDEMDEGFYMLMGCGKAGSCDTGCEGKDDRQGNDGCGAGFKHRELAYIANIKNSATMGFKTFDMRGVKSFAVTTRGYGAGTFEIRTSWDGVVYGKIKIESTNVWVRYETPIQIPDGIHDIYLTYTGDGFTSLKSFELG